MANNYSDASIQPPLPASLFSEAEIQLMQDACSVVCRHDGDGLRLFGESYFTTHGEDWDENPLDLLAFLQSKLQQLDAAAYPLIAIHGACYCDKKRPDEFGGFAYVITRTAIRSFSTWEWLEAQTAETTGQNGGRP